MVLIFISVMANDIEWASQVALVEKNPPTNAGDVRDTGLIPGSGRFPGGGNGTPLQYSCLENPMDRGPWRSTAHGVTKSRTRLKQRSIHVTFTKSSNRVTIIFFPRVCSPILTNLILTISLRGE